MTLVRIAKGPPTRHSRLMLLAWLASRPAAQGVVQVFTRNPGSLGWISRDRSQEVRRWAKKPHECAVNDGKAL